MVDMEEIKKSLRKIITRTMLLNAYFGARRHKRYTESQILFEIDLNRNLEKLYQEIINGKYEISKSICFIVTRPKPREVFAANFRDRIVHHLVMQFLLPKFEKIFIKNSFSCMKNRGTTCGALKLKQALLRNPGGYVFKFDIKGFFMSIDKSRLNDKLQELIKEEFKYDSEDLRNILSYFIKKIVMHHPEENCEKHGDIEMWKLIPNHKSLFTIPKHLGLAIGNLTSQLFANYYLHKFDLFMFSLFGYNYGRYVDDFFVVCKNKEEVLSIIPKMEQLLLEEGLVHHPDKRYSQPVCHGCKFIGTVIKGSRVYIGNGTKSNMMNKIYQFNKYAEEINETNLVKFLRTMNSYLGFMRYKKTFNIRRNLIFSIDPRWWDYLEVDRDFTTIYFKDEYKYLNKLD